MVQKWGLCSPLKHLDCNLQHYNLYTRTVTVARVNVCRFSPRFCEDKSFTLKLQSCPPSCLCVMWPGHLVIHSFWAGLYTILLHEDHHGNTRSGRSSWLPLSSFQVGCTWTVLTLIPSICRQNCWTNQNFLHYFEFSVSYEHIRIVISKGA